VDVSVCVEAEVTVEVVVTGGSVAVVEVVVDVELGLQRTVPWVTAGRLPPTTIWSLPRLAFWEMPCTPHAVPYDTAV
jgi:hypothetical protein